MKTRVVKLRLVGSLSLECAGGGTEKRHKGASSSLPFIAATSLDLFTSLPAQHWILIYLSSSVGHCTKVSGHSVSLFIVSRRQLCLCETAFTRRSFTRSRASLLVHHRQCALVNVRKVYEIYAGGHNLVNVWKMGNRRCPAARSRVIHCGPKAPQGAHPLIL